MRRKYARKGMTRNGKIRVRIVHDAKRAPVRSGVAQKSTKICQGLLQRGPHDSQGQDLGFVAQKPRAISGDFRGNGLEIFDFSAADLLDDLSKTYNKDIALLG